MNIRCLNDIHLEFDAEGGWTDFALPFLDGESEMVLVLAGDITAEMDRDNLAGRYWSRHTNWVKALAKRHKAVVMVAGNHEFYHGVMEDVREWWANVDATVDNFHFLDNKTVIIDGVRFIGSTLWTSMRGGDPMVALRAAYGMNDFKHIWMRDGENTRNFSAADFIAEHALAVDYIRTRTATPFDGPTVVVTHHAPSWMSIPEKFRENKLNDCYATELSDIMYNDIALWLHGHVHANSDYIIGGTRVVNNPRGYNGAVPNLNDGFNPKLVITI